MFEFKILGVCLLISLCNSAIVSKGDQSDREISPTNGYDVHMLYREISDRLDKWDAFYMGRLEPRMVGAATSLANLDANVRNLQERAHVWDTFQLHVSAWNEQIKSLDHKVNIINEGNKKLLTLDAQLNTALNLNFTLDALSRQILLVDERVKIVAMNPTRLHELQDSTTKGLVHVVRFLERKVDRLIATIDKIAGTKTNTEWPSSEDEREKMTLDALESNSVVRILHDISSKVDAIYDKSEKEDDVMIRSPHTVCRRLAAPYKKISSSVDYMKGILQDLVDETPAISDKASLRQRRRLSALDQVKDTLEDVERSIVQLGRQQDRNINENERILRRIDKKVAELDREEDELEKLLTKKLNRIEKQLRSINNKVDDDDDDDDKSKNDDDSDDTDEDNDSNDNNKRRKNNKNDDDSDDDDDDSDDDDSNGHGHKKHRSGKKNKNHDNDSDDDDDDDDDNDDDDDSDGNGHKRNRSGKKGKHDNDSDDDDDDDDDDDSNGHGHKKHRSSKKGKHDNSDDDDDDDDDDDNDSKKHDNNSKENDSDDNDSDGKKKHSDKNDDSHDDDDDDDDDNNDNSNGRHNRLTNASKIEPVTGQLYEILP